MAVYGLPVIATLALWWASTGVILYLDGRPCAPSLEFRRARVSCSVSPFWGWRARAG